MKNKLLVLFTSAALTLGMLTFAAPALAKSEFPPMIQGYLQLGYTPPCRLCHIDGKTAKGTLRTPFVLSMRERGLTGATDVNMLETLDKIRAERVDSDGDGKPDVEELMSRNDPNSPAAGAMLADDPGGGCALSGSGSRATAWGIIGLAVAALWNRRAMMTAR